MLLLTWALLAALPATGLPTDSCGLYALGWTPDGDFFVYKQAQTLYAGGERAGVRVVYAKVVDAASGTEERYLIEPTGASADDHAQLARLELPNPQADAFAQWLQQHPLQPAALPPVCSGRTLQVRGDNAAGSWRDGVFAFAAEHPGTMELVASVRTSEASVRTSEASVVSARWQLHGVATKAGAMAGQVRGVCSANGLRVAWLSCRIGDEAGGVAQPAESKVVLGPAGGPRIELLGSSKLNDRALKKVTDALARAGFVPSRRGIDPDSRKRSVVYAPHALMDLAHRVAQAIPAGATVEPLTWQADCDMVVAIAAPSR